MKKLLLATNNHGKVAEMRALLAALPLNLLTPADLHLELEVTEDGSSYAENATRKALAFARAAGLAALGDDSGLEVDALLGRPGLHSHRFCPLPNATDADRRIYLLEQLAGLPRPWTARFQATVALALPDGQVHLAAGSCEGEIIPQERGTHGFGYDPLFLLPGIGLTMAELSMDRKNELSHRARAVRNAIPLLREAMNLS
jgi:XTP/dITP diphosphohydrolase